MPNKGFDWILVGDGLAAGASRIQLGKSGLGGRGLQIARPASKSGFRIGEYLSSAANGVLKELGLWDDFLTQRHLESASRFSSWGSTLLDERNALAHPREVGWSLDRDAFDQWIRVQASEYPCEQIWATVVGVETDTGKGICLNLDNGDPIRGRFVLDASGRSAVVVRNECRRERLDRLTANYNYLIQIDEGVEPTPGPMVEAQKDGWLYSALLPARKMVIAWFTDSDLMPKPKDGEGSEKGRNRLWRERIEASNYTLRRVESAGYSLDRCYLESVQLADASTRVSPTVAGSAWAAAGDAAASFDPLASHGMASALWSGSAAANAIKEAIFGNQEALQDYNRRFMAGIERLRKERITNYAAERRFESPFWQRRHRPQYH